MMRGSTTFAPDTDETRYGTLIAAIMVVTRSAAIEQSAARYVSESLNNSGAMALALLMCVALGAVILVDVPHRLARALAAAWPMFAFCGFSLASAIWSTVPASTTQETLHVIFTVVAATFLAALTSWRQLIRGMAIGLVAVSLASLLTIPFGGIDQDIHAGALQGFWEEKNGAGQVYAYAGIACASLAALERRPTWLWGVPVMGLLTVLSDSTTSLLCLMLGLAILSGIFLAGNRHPGRAILIFWATAVSVGFGILIWLNFEDQIFALLGKDPTLTGRSEVWESVLRRIEERPWIGYGYHAFWDEASPYARWVRHEVAFDVFNAHSSWLEAMLSVGLIGTSLLVWFAVRSILGAGGGVFLPDDNRRFALPILLAMLVISLSESILIGAAGIGWFVYLAFGIKAAMGPAISPTAQPLSLRRMKASTDVIYL